MKCPICPGKMNEIEDKIEQDKVAFTAYKCEKCSEEIMNMKQLKSLAVKYRALRRAKEITFVKWGNSLAVRIPQEFAQELHIEEGDHGLLKADKGELIIATV